MCIVRYSGTVALCFLLATCVSSPSLTGKFYIVGDVRVQVLSETLVRIEQKGPQGFTDAVTYHVTDRIWPGATMIVEIDGDYVHVGTSTYTVNIPNGAKTLDGVTVTTQGGDVLWRFSGLPSAEIPLPPPGNTPLAWGMADNPRVIVPSWGYTPARSFGINQYNGWNPHNQAQDMYIFVSGGDPFQLRRDFLKLTGRPELVPLKTLGLWHSRYFNYRDYEILDHIDEYRSHGYPLDYFVIDTDWRSTEGGFGTGYDINTNSFPPQQGQEKDPYSGMRDFLQNRLPQKNVQTIFNDHPEPLRDGSSGREMHALEHTEIVYRNENLRKLLSTGLDAWWFDKNWHTTIISPFDGIHRNAFGAYAYHDVIQDFFSKDSRFVALGGKRPFMMSNIDGVDNSYFGHYPNLAGHRFSIQWTGDTFHFNDYLKRDIEALVRAGAETATPYISSDLGGHNGHPTSMSHIRWSQFGALSPIMRYHSYTPHFREPWKFGKMADEVNRAYILMRYRLIPLLYSLAHKSYEDGVPIAKRLDFNYPMYSESKDNTQYMLGDGILVAPIWNVTGGSGAPEEIGTNFTDIPADWISDTSGSLTSGNSWSGVIENRSGSDMVLVITNSRGTNLWMNEVLMVERFGEDFHVNEDNRRDISTYAGIIPAGNRANVRYELSGQGRFWNNNNRFQYVPVSQMREARDVFIPDGRWIDAWTGEIHVGPKTIRALHGPQTSPLFIRSGTIVPLVTGDVEYIDTAKNWQEISLDVYPGVEVSGTQILYEDDEISNAYKTGVVRKTDLSTSFDSVTGEVLVNIGAAQGTFEGAGAITARTWNIRIHVPADWGSVRSVIADGATISSYTLIPKNALAMPFGFKGGAPDGAVYEIVIPLSPLGTPHEIRAAFEKTVAERLPEHAVGVVDYSLETGMMGENINLSAIGLKDWVHFGTGGRTGDITRREGGNAIGSLVVNGTSKPVTSEFTTFRWQDATGETTGQDKYGISIGTGSLEFNVGVDSSQSVITLYIAGENTVGRLEVSDGRSVDFLDMDGRSFSNRVAINATAERASTICIRWRNMSNTGSISLFAAAVVKPENLPTIPVEVKVEIAPITGNIDLTNGTADWIHLGYNPDDPEGYGMARSIVRKADVRRLLHEPVFPQNVWEVNDFNSWNNANNPATPESLRGEGQGISYTDGLIIENSQAQRRVSVYGNTQANATPDNSFLIAASSTSSWRRLTLYLGQWHSTQRIEVYGEFDDRVSTYRMTHNGRDEDRIRSVNIDFRSDEDTILFVRLVKESGENIALAAYTLSELQR